MAIVLTEQVVSEMAPNPKALLDGRGIVKKGALKKLGKNDDATLVFGFCQGSGKNPYEVSIDLETGGDRPTVRCSCPSHQFPCKHGMALMLAFVANGAAFPVGAPPAGLLEKRAKIVQRAEKKASAPEEPKKVNKAALAKKTEEQGAALDTLETFVTDLVSGGLGGLGSKHIKAIDTQSKRMRDAQLGGAADTLLRLSALVSADDDDDDDDEEEGKKAARGLSEEKQAQIASLVTKLWTTIRKGRRALEGKLEEGATQGEADAQVESILGRAYQLPELKAAGYWITDRTVMELAHERTDDAVTEMAATTGWLVDLGDGSIYREWTSVPVNAMKFGAKLRSSRPGTVSIKEAALYPGDVMNRRIRWEDKLVTERPRIAEDFPLIHAQARPLDTLVKALRSQIKNPLNDQEGVGLLAVARFGAIGDALVAEDAAGARLVIKDPKRASFTTSRNLRYAAGAFGAGSLLVRLYFDWTERAVLGQALALVAGDQHVRLGM